MEKSLIALICRGYLGHTKDSMAYTTVANAMLVRKFFTFIADTENGNFKTSHAIQTLRGGASAVLGVHITYFAYFDF